jgi:hypothetical protein
MPLALALGCAMHTVPFSVDLRSKCAVQWVLMIRCAACSVDLGVQCALRSGWSGVVGCAVLCDTSMCGVQVHCAMSMRSAQCDVQCAVR